MPPYNQHTHAKPFTFATIFTVHSTCFASAPQRYPRTATMMNDIRALTETNNVT